MTQETDLTPQQQAYKLLEEGVRLLNAGRYGEAIEVLREAEALNPDDADILITLSAAMILAGQWNKAEAFLEKAVQKHPQNAKLWLNFAAAILGRLPLSTKERQDRAIEAYKRAIELNPVADSAHYNVGLIHAERKDWDQAAQWFEAAIRANPRDKDARTWLKRAQAKQEEATADD